MSNILKKILSKYPETEFVKYDDFDDCLIGTAENAEFLPVLCYDKDMILDKIMRLYDMNYEDALIFYDDEFLSNIEADSELLPVIFQRVK